MKQHAIIRGFKDRLPKLAKGRAQLTADTIKDWIVELGLKPGDRLPQEPELIEKLKVSKGTLRESLKILETQDLIRMKTCPGGGAFISEMRVNVATSLLSSHFFFKELSIADIYELRIILEPQLVKGLATHIDQEQIGILKSKMTVYLQPPKSIKEEPEHRQKELEFHEYMASLCKNPLLSFVCTFLIKLLKDLTVCQRIYNMPNQELRESGLAYQVRLLEAFSDQDGQAAYDIMHEHMISAKQLMTLKEAKIKKGFL